MAEAGQKDRGPQNTSEPTGSAGDCGWKLARQGCKLKLKVMQIKSFESSKVEGQSLEARSSSAEHQCNAGVN